MASKKKSRSKNVTAAAPASVPVETAEAAPAVETASPAPAAAVVRSATTLPKWMSWAVPVLAATFFLGTCLTGSSTIKVLTMILMVAAVASCLIRFSLVRERLSLPVAAVAVWLLLNGVSTLYAVSGKFALQEFLKLMVGFCVLLLILAWSRKSWDNGRAVASVLAGGTALASLVSIDMLSTHLLSGVIVNFLLSFSNDYMNASLNPVEAGVRMNSLYENPNVFAGIAGLGVLLSLELAVTSRREKERPFHLCCLFLNALAFLLVFSMGASGMICLAFLALLILERRSRKPALLVLMLETLVLALLGAFPIYLTSFDHWDGVQPIPLLCAVVGAAGLCLLDRFVGQRAAALLEKQSGARLGILTGGVLVLLGVFAALAMNLTGPAALSAGEGLRRAEYPDPGTYTLELQTSGDVQVTIESQNQQETMMHTGTVLYSGPAQGAAFTVPEGSLVTYFNFRAGEDLTLTSAALVGPEGSTELKLDYKLLPGFIANRLQGLFANENAIQRVVFFSDGMKLFHRSPVFGLGLGTFENSIQNVQSFHYETKYAHNHYVETLVCTGVVGLILFVGMLLLCALALWKNLRRGEEAHPMAPALAAALIFMIGHAGVEVVFSFHSYLPMALGVLGLICLCCGGELPLPGKEKVRSGVVVGLCAMVAVFAVLLGMNMKALDTAENNLMGDPFRSLERAAKMDLFEKNDYLLSYVVMAQDVDREKNPTVYSTANEYAQRLGQVGSISIPPYLANYYFATDQPEEAIAALKKYVNYVSSNSETWQTAFTFMETWTMPYPQCQTAAAEFYEMFQSWNEAHMGSLTLTEANRQYLATLGIL